MPTIHLGDLPRTQPSKMWNRQRSINDIAAIVYVSYGTEQAILMSALNNHRIAAKFVPWLLTPDQKELGTEICQDLHQRVLDGPTFMSRGRDMGLRRGDQTTVFAVEDPNISTIDEGEIGPQRDQEHDHRFLRHSQRCSPWIRPRGPDRQRQVLLQLSEVSEGGHSGETPWTVHEGNWMLHDDNAPSYRALVTPEFIGRNSMVTLLHPPYSSDLAHCNFFFFPKMKL